MNLLEKLKKFQWIIAIFLILLLSIVIFVSAIELGWILVEELLKPPFMLLNVKELLRIFGFFLMILIGIELLESIKTYFTAQHLHIEVVFTVAMIAVARKVITIEMTKVSPFVLVGIASLIIALSAGYYLVKRSHQFESDMNTD